MFIVYLIYPLFSASNPGFLEIARRGSHAQSPLNTAGVSSSQPFSSLASLELSSPAWNCTFVPLRCQFQVSFSVWKSGAKGLLLEHWSISYCGGIKGLGRAWKSRMGWWGHPERFPAEEESQLLFGVWLLLTVVCCGRRFGTVNCWGRAAQYI